MGRDRASISSKYQQVTATYASSSPTFYSKIVINLEILFASEAFPLKITAFYCY